MEPSVLPPNALIIGDVEQPMVRVQPYTPEDGEQRTPLSLSPSQLAAFGALLQHVPGVAIGTAQALSQTYVLRFAPQVTQQLLSGSATMMKSLEGGMRAAAVGSNGQIIGVGTLVATTGLQVAGVALAAWQVLALITAQHYLADINTRLAALEAGVESIKQHMEDANIATLVTDFKQLNVMYTTILYGQLSDPELTNLLVQVDTIERIAGRIAETYRMRMAREATTLKKQNMTGWFDPAIEVTRAQRRVHAFSSAAHISLIATAVRAAATIVRCALPGERTMMMHRVKAIRTDLAQTLTQIHSFLTVSEQQANKAGAYWDVKFWEDKKSYQRPLLSLVTQSGSHLVATFEPIVQALNETHTRLQVQIAAQDQPLDVLVALDGQGRITRVEYLAVTSL